MDIDCGGSLKNNENWIDTAIEKQKKNPDLFNLPSKKIYNSGIVCWRRL